MQRSVPITHALGVAGALVLAFALGAWSRGGAPIQAASSSLLYQFTEQGPGASLALYSDTEHAIYVYRGITAGSSHVNCAYRLTVSRPGAPIDRENCAPGSLFH